MKSCSFVDLNRSLFYYHQTKPKNNEDQLIVSSIKELQKKAKMGAKKLAKILSTNNNPINHKRVARILRENNLCVKPNRRRKRRNIRNVERLPIPLAVKKRNDVWSIDFMCSRKNNSFRFMLFNVVDLSSRIAPTMVVERSFTSKDVTYELEVAIKKYGIPKGIITDNGVEFTSSHFRIWCKRNKIIHFLTNKGSPAENSFVESFNSSVRREVLDDNDFSNINELRKKIKRWGSFYNEIRPHGSLDYMSPKNYEYLAMNGK